LNKNLADNYSIVFFTQFVSVTISFLFAIPPVL